jgi:hypothetical protein
MQEEQLSKEKSLEIIQQMISQAKSNISDNGLGWLLWGSMIIAAAVSTYVFIEIDADQIFLGWNIFGIVTIVLLLWDVFKPRRKKVRTYIDDLLRLADLGFIISLFTIIFAINVAVHPNAGFGFFMMIFGMFMLIKGGAVKSKSLMAGAAVNWTGAIAMFLNKDFKYDMLIMAAAVLIGYIIPGMILWQQYRKSTRQLQ